LTHSPPLILTEDANIFKGVNIPVSNFSLAAGYTMPSYNNTPTPAMMQQQMGYVLQQDQQQSMGYAPQQGQQQPMGYAPQGQQQPIPQDQHMMPPMSIMPSTSPGKVMVQATVPAGVPPGGIFNIMTPDGRTVAGRFHQEFIQELYFKWRCRGSRMVPSMNKLWKM
jgi:hypothetical protein